LFIIILQDKEQPRGACATVSLLEFETSALVLSTLQNSGYQPKFGEKWTSESIPGRHQSTEASSDRCCDSLGQSVINTIELMSAAIQTSPCLCLRQWNLKNMLISSIVSYHI